MNPDQFIIACRNESNGKTVIPGTLWSLGYTKLTLILLASMISYYGQVSMHAKYFTAS